MIKTEMMKYNTLIRHFSDEGKMIRQVETGAIYSEAKFIVFRMQRLLFQEAIRNGMIRVPDKFFR